MIAAAKMVAVSCTTPVSGRIHPPLFYIGAAVGLAISCCSTTTPDNRHDLHDGSSQCGITKTPISTTVFSVLSDTAMVPVIVVASFVSFHC